MTNIFFTGCTHFDHANIINLCNRPFKDVEEMNETMIENWNKDIGTDDIVYHLGDFGFINSRRRFYEIFDRLNGHKHLIYGNHDKEAVTSSPLWWGRNPYLELNLQQTQKIVLFHYPIEDWNGRYKGSIHLHCHTHGSEFMNSVNYVGPSGSNRFNVGVDACGFAPVALEQILEVAQ